MAHAAGGKCNRLSRRVWRAAGDVFSAVGNPFALKLPTPRGSINHLE
jgi:hypothetical protein